MEMWGLLRNGKPQKSALLMVDINIMDAEISSWSGASEKQVLAAWSGHRGHTHWDGKLMLVSAEQPAAAVSILATGDNHDCGSIVVIVVTVTLWSPRRGWVVLHIQTWYSVLTASSRLLQTAVSIQTLWSPTWAGWAELDPATGTLWPVTRLTLIPPPPQLTTALHTTTHSQISSKQQSTLDSWVDIKESPDILVDIKNVAASYLHIQGVVFDVDWEYGF